MLPSAAKTALGAGTKKMVFFLSIVFFLFIVFTAGRLPRAGGGETAERRVGKADGRSVSADAENIERARRMVAERMREISEMAKAGDSSDYSDSDCDGDADDAPDDYLQPREPEGSFEDAEVLEEYTENPAPSPEGEQASRSEYADMLALLRAAEAEAERARIARLDAEEEAARIATAAVGGDGAERAASAWEFSDGARIREILSSREGLAAAFVSAESLSPGAALEDKTFCDKPLI